MANPGKLIQIFFRKFQFPGQTVLLENNPYMTTLEIWALGSNAHADTHLDQKTSIFLKMSESNLSTYFFSSMRMLLSGKFYVDSENMTP